MTETFPGKIRSVEFGNGGYQNAMFGLTVYLETDHGSSADFWGFWKNRADTEKHEQAMLVTMKKIERLFIDAKASKLEELVGKPVMVTWTDFKLVHWEVIKECV